MPVRKERKRSWDSRRRSMLIWSFRKDFRGEGVCVFESWVWIWILGEALLGGRGGGSAGGGGHGGIWIWILE